MKIADISPLSVSYTHLDVYKRQHPNRVAVMYGPVVLVRPDPARLVLSAPSLAKSFNSRDREGLEFELVGQPGGMMLPFYKVGHLQPYTMYFDLNT